MLIDALRAEFWRLLHHRAALIWGFVFLPVMILVGLMGSAIWARANGILVDNMDMNALDLPLSTLERLPGPWLMFFSLIGAANMFAADYRFETWRLTVPRNARAMIIVARLTVFAVAVLASIAAILLAQILATVFALVLAGTAPSFSAPELVATNLASLVGLGIWRLLQFSLIVLLVAILTRSIMAAVLLPLLMLGVEYTLIGMMGTGAANPDWRSVLALPTLAFNILSAHAQSIAAAPGSVVGTDAVHKALVSMGLWTLGPLALALALFQRQTLSRE